MHKISTRIFSKNRAAQLDYLLSSISEYDSGNILDVSVQFACSDETYLEGYEKLMKMYPVIPFSRDSEFNEPVSISPLRGEIFFNLVFWLSNKRYRYSVSEFKINLLDYLGSVDSENVMFLTDDSRFYRKIEISSEILELLKRDHSASYSMALGRNIHGFNKKSDPERYMHIPVTDGNTDIWDYAFSVDGRIYNTGFLRKLLNRIIFTNPNTLEALCVKYNSYKKVFKSVYTNDESCLIGFELNQVQTTFINKQLGIDPGIINNYFIDGYRLVIDHADVNSFRPEISGIRMKKDQKEVALYRHSS